MSSAAVSPRPPISLYTIVAHAEGYTFAAKVWALSLVQGSFSVVPNPNRPIRNFRVAER
jgi:hypothetical protein